MPDCLVIGGGIIGLSLAYELATHGLTTRVLDRSRGRRRASWAAAGVLPPPAAAGPQDALERLRALSHELYPSWTERLAEESGIDVGFHRCGGIYLAQGLGEAAALRATAQQWRAAGITLDTLSQSDLVRLEPALAAAVPFRCAYRSPEEAQVRPTRLLKALHHCLQRRGVAIHHHLTVTGWVTASRGRAGVRTNQGVLQPDWICIAAGPWTAPLLRGLGVDTDVEPRRGQMVAWQTPQPLLRHVLNEGPRYLVCRKDGWLLAGSTVEDVGFDDDTTADGREQLMSFASQWIPALQHHPVRKAWAGLRPATRDGLPLLGRLAGWDNVIVATGHFRSGIHLAPATATIVGQMIRGEPPPVDLLPLTPTRS